MFEKYKKVYKADYEKWYKENEAYRQRVAADQDRLKFHLMPKTGWLNDPNGLCQFNGTYHIYYQYTPFEPTGELKTWGHYTTKDFIHYEDHGVAMYPDTESDSFGCYTGMALKEGEQVVTSHISSKYLQGLLVGYISEVNVDSNNLTRSGYIIPATDFKELQEVLVITTTKQDLIDGKGESGSDNGGE